MSRNSSRLVKLCKIGILGAVAGVVMSFEFPLLFMAPSFYQLDLSEVVVMMGGFALGPSAVFPIELIKVLIKIFVKGTYSMGVGELSNLVLGVALTFPAALWFSRRRTVRGAVTGMAMGTALITLLSPVINGLIMIPFYVAVMGMPYDAIISGGTEVYSAVTNIYTFLLLIVVPFNLLKGVVSSAVAGLLYRPLSPLLKWEGKRR